MARGPYFWGGLAAVTAGAIVAAAAGRATMPPFLPLGDHAVYDASASRALTLVEPIAHAPWLGALGVPLSLLVAGLVMASLWVASHRLGASVGATLVAAAGLLCRPDLRAPLALGAAPVVAIALVWASLVVWLDGVSVRRRVWGSVLAAGAVVAWPPSLSVAPIVVATMGVRGLRDGVLAATAIAMGLAGGIALWATVAGTLAGETVSLADVWTVIVDTSPRGHHPYVWPSLSAVELPVALAASGATAFLLGRGAGGVAAAAAVAAMVVAMLVLPAWRPEIVRALYWTSWPLVAVGLTWLADRASSAGRAFALGGVGAALVAGGLAASLRPVESAEARSFGAALAQALRPSMAGAVSFVAEDTRVDTALTAWRGGGTPVERVRQLPGLVGGAFETGRTVLAGPAGRTALELWGFRFAPRVVVRAPVPFRMGVVTGRFRCLLVGQPWRELPGLEFTGRLGLHVPAGPGRLELVVVAAPPLDLRFTAGGGRPVGEVTTVPMSLTDLPPVLWPGGGRLPDEALEARSVQVSGGQTPLDGSLALGVRAPLVAVRYRGEAASASVCAAPLPRDDPFDESRDTAASIALDDPAYFGGGWHSAEGTGATAFRWTTRRAIILVPVRRARAVRLAIDARPAADIVPGPVILRAVVNGWVATEQPMVAGARTYTWSVPAAVWVDGTGEVALEVSRTLRPSDRGGADTRELGLQVTAFRISAP